MQGANWSSSTTTVNLEMLSPKQLIGECLDMAAVVLREVSEIYCQNTKTELPANSKNDFTQFVSFILDPARFDRIVENFVTVDVLSKKQFIKTWVNELRNIRNAWAHWAPQNLDYRLANRAYDTLSLLFAALGGNQHGELFMKIEFYRKGLLIATAKSYHFAEQRH